MNANIPKLTREKKLTIFGEGEWLDEPDFLEFDHKGIKCVIYRMDIGNLCGYVKIPEDHILYREVNNDIEREFDVHGGINFNTMIDDEHWIGFDCVHSTDISPSIEMFKKTHGKDVYKSYEEILERFELKSIFKPTYKNIEFVKQELMSLADQVLEYGK